MSAPHHDPASKLKLELGGLSRLWPKQLPKLARRYHAHLVAKAEAEDVYFGSQSVAMPWFLLVLPLLPWGVIFKPSGPVWAGAILLTLAVSLTGGIYSATVFIVHSSRAAKRRRSSDPDLLRPDDR